MKTGFGLILAFAATLGTGEARAARLGLNPVMGDGADGRPVVLSGAGFQGLAVYSVLVGGKTPSPATVQALGTGVIAATTLALPALPAGAHDVVLTGGGRVLTFLGAYRVSRNICISPAQGDGRAGIIWTAGNLNGAWTGMVFRIEGTGFMAGATINQNSILVGTAFTNHPAIAVGTDGRLPSTTVIIGSNLSLGRRDITIDDGTVTVFPGVYEVRRSIALDPARGSREIGTVIRITGWGFVDAAGPPNIPQDSITIGVFPTTHNPVSVANGYFTVNVTLGAKAQGTYPVNIPGQENFPNAYMGRPATNQHLAVSPVVLDGVPNQSFQVTGLANWAAGTIAANSITVGTALGATVATTSHDAIIVAANGTFPAAWVRLDGPIPATADRITIMNPGGGAVGSVSLFTKTTTGLCPVVSNGAAGFTVSVTGFAFNPVAAITAITANGSAVSYPATTTRAGGDFGPLALSLPALPYGDRTVVITAGAASTFANLLDATRSIGLSYVVGPGIAGDSVSINGSGFTGGSSLSAGSILFGVASVNPGAIGVGANGSFGPSALTLPALSAGSYDVTAQEVFIRAYRVYNPLVEIAKHRSIPASPMPAGAVVDYIFSFTNTGIVGDPRAVSLVISDNIPAGVRYDVGTTFSVLPAVMQWYHTGCSCWNNADMPVADLTRIRWTLSAPLPSGASGYAGFKATVL